MSVTYKEYFENILLDIQQKEVDFRTKINDIINEIVSTQTDISYMNDNCYIVSFSKVICCSVFSTEYYSWKYSGKILIDILKQKNIFDIIPTIKGIYNNTTQKLPNVCYYRYKNYNQPFDKKLIELIINKIESL